MTVCDRCQHEKPHTDCASIPVKYIDRHGNEGLRLLGTELCEDCLEDLHEVTKKYLMFKGE